MTTSNGTYYEGYWPFLETSSIDELNKLTDPQGETKGRLLKKDVIAVAGSPWFLSVYTIGVPIPERQQTPVERKLEVASVLNGLTWKKFPTGPGEWAFATTKENDTVAALKPFQPWLDNLQAKGDEGIALGPYRYTLKQDRKFLNRFPVAGVPA